MHVLKQYWRRIVIAVGGIIVVLVWLLANIPFRTTLQSRTLAQCTQEPFYQELTRQLSRMNRTLTHGVSDADVMWGDVYIITDRFLLNGERKTVIMPYATTDIQGAGDVADWGFSIQKLSFRMQNGKVMQDTATHISHMQLSITAQSSAQVQSRAATEEPSSSEVVVFTNKQLQSQYKGATADSFDVQVAVEDIKSAMHTQESGTITATWQGEISITSGLFATPTALLFLQDSKAYSNAAQN